MWDPDKVLYNYFLSPYSKILDEEKAIQFIRKPEFDLFSNILTQN